MVGYLNVGNHNNPKAVNCAIEASRLCSEATEHGAGKSLRSLLGDEITKIKSAPPKVLVGINNIYGWSPPANGIFLNPTEALSAVF